MGLLKIAGEVVSLKFTRQLRVPLNRSIAIGAVKNC